MFEIKCDDCGNNATVPFKPKEGKPVYCSTCFSKRVKSKRESYNLNFGFNTKNAWARRGGDFKGKKEEGRPSIFQKY